jgi:uncharacterized protein (TIGR00369 family)
MAEPLPPEALRAQMAASPFIANMGMELVSADPEAETLTVAMPMKPELERGMGLGQMHGGPIAALIDTAGCFALVMLLAKGVPTVNFRTDYLRPVMNSGLTAVAKVRRTGRTVGVVDVDVQDDAGRLVAVGRGTFGTSA